jgi:phage terminase small subunit
MSKLTPKQARFCEEYLIDLNATQAAIRAGYSAKTADRIASENLRKLEVQAKIEELRQIQQERTQATADRVVEKLWKIANFDIRSVCENKDGRLVFKPVSEWDETALSTMLISGKDKEGNPIVKMESRQSALDSLAKHLGMYDNFNTAVACLRTYGLLLQRADNGDWSVNDINVARLG